MAIESPEKIYFEKLELMALFAWRFTNVHGQPNSPTVQRRNIVSPSAKKYFVLSFIPLQVTHIPIIDILSYYVSPIKIYIFIGRYIDLLLTAHLFVTSVLCLCVLSVYHAGGRTRDLGWVNVGPPSTRLSKH